MRALLDLDAGREVRGGGELHDGRLRELRILQRLADEARLGLHQERHAFVVLFALEEDLLLQRVVLVEPEVDRHADRDADVVDDLGRAAERVPGRRLEAAAARGLELVLVDDAAVEEAAARLEAQLVHDVDAGAAEEAVDRVRLDGAVLHAGLLHAGLGARGRRRASRS